MIYINRMKLHYCESKSSCWWIATWWSLLRVAQFQTVILQIAARCKIILMTCLNKAPLHYGHWGFPPKSFVPWLPIPRMQWSRVRPNKLSFLRSFLRQTGFTLQHPWSFTRCLCHAPSENARFDCMLNLVNIFSESTGLGWMRRCAVVALFF